MNKKRPDILFKNGDRVLMLGEVKTPYATQDARKKEMSRLIERSVESLKIVTGIYDFNGKNPNMFVVRFDGVHTIIYEMTMGKKIFWLHQVGQITLPTHLADDQLDIIVESVYKVEILLKRLTRIHSGVQRTWHQRTEHPAHELSDTPIKEKTHGTKTVRDKRSKE
ncbi:hypothetical protein HDU87_002136 [Geranomyces variabilis]|uniref:Uncharacterized protein n=1 Tax=Geranomyces variabilis TaxID=109894 RepID=A0AAD5TNY3_9FUNG|nr:hypothetical protein HDU87_002136 [Geranomyces variabilis]